MGSGDLEESIFYYDTYCAISKVGIFPMLCNSRIPAITVVIYHVHLEQLFPYQV